MKYLLIFILAFVVSCGLFKKNKTMHYGDENGKGGGNSQKDSVSVTLTMPGDSEYVNYNHITLTSNDELWFPPKPKSAENLKIITIQNTKVISKSTDMSDGRVVYKIPQEMKIRSTYKVLLRISKSKAILSVYDSLQGEVRTSEIPVTQTMSVSLIDPSPEDDKAFKIVPDNISAIQQVDSGDTYTEWTWNVTPIKVGNYNIKLVVSTVRNGVPKDVVYEDVVKVEIDPIAQILFFWNKWWQWIVGTLISPFIIWLYKNRKKKKEEA